MAYNKIVRWMIVILYMSYSIPIYSMDDELNDPAGRESHNSYTLLGRDWASRYCPSWLRSDRAANRIPVIAPTQSSSMATIPSKYSRKQIAMITGLTITAGVMGYYIGNTCQMCTDELRNAQRYVGEMDDAFNACTDTTNYLTAVVSNLTIEIAECVTNIDGLKDTIIEYCSN
jgi:hypothetical protein